MIYERPWGTYEVLLDEPNYKVKRIVVDPEKKFSLQYHNTRAEYWTIVDGSGLIEIDGEEHSGVIGTFWYVPCGILHRATAGKDALTFIETQIGECVEDDIVRVEDDYGRT